MKYSEQRRGAGLALALTVGLPWVLNAETILVDIQPGGNGGSIASTSADFQGYDPIVAAAAPVNAVDGWGALQGLAAADENGATYTITTEGGVNGGWNGGAAAWTDGTGIIEGYAYEQDAFPEVNTVTVAGLAGIPVGHLVTLTVFAIGDNVGQEAAVTASYAGVALETKNTFFGVGQGEGTDAVPSVQWQFPADGSDEVSFTWGHAEDNTSGFAALNGFSITTVDAEFGAAQSVVLTPETSTVLTESPAVVQLTAIATFTNVGDLDVSSQTEFVQYSATPTGIVEISDTGLVTPLGAGTATITATVQGDVGGTVDDTVTFTVEDPTSLTVTIDDPILLANAWETKVSVTADSASLTDVPVTDYIALELDVENGELDLFQEDDGTFTLTPFDEAVVDKVQASLVDATGEATVTVEAATSIEAVATPSDQLFVGGSVITIQVTADSASLMDIPLQLDGQVADSLDFFSSDFGIADVGGEGVVTPEAEGTVDVTVSFDGVPDVIVPLTVNLIPDKPTALVHRYSFNEADGTTVTDSVGGQNGTVEGADGVFSGTHLTTPGGAEGSGAAYVDLPNGMISALPNAVTFELWASRTSTADWERFFDFGSSAAGEGATGTGQTYLILTPQNGNTGTAHVSYTTSSFGGESTRLNPIEEIGEIGAIERHYVITYDSEVGQAKWYVDGVFQGEQVFNIDGAALADLDDVNNWLGRSQWGNPRIGANYNEFRIHSGIMNLEGVAASLAAGPDAGIVVPSPDEVVVQSVAYNADAPSVTIVIETEVDKAYIVEYSDSLTEDSWTAAPEGSFTATATTTTYTDASITTETGVRFYRVRVVDAP